jgi:hypothetical protein
MKALFLMVVASLFWQGAHAATLWRCQQPEGVVIYTNQGAEFVRYISCSPEKIFNKEKNVSEDKYRCLAEYTTGSSSYIATSVSDTDLSLKVVPCKVLSVAKGKPEQEPKAKGESDWVKVLTSAKGDDYYINKSTIRRSGSVAVGADRKLTH